MRCRISPTKPMMDVDFSPGSQSWVGGSYIGLEFGKCTGARREVTVIRHGARCRARGCGRLDGCRDVLERRHRAAAHAMCLAAKKASDGVACMSNAPAEGRRNVTARYS